MIHRAVLLKQTIDIIKENISRIEADTWYLDATLGAGEHAFNIAKIFEDKLNLIAFDLDPRAIREAETRLDSLFDKTIYINENFRNIEKNLDQNNIEKIKIALFDFGLSSDEIHDSFKGFSFMGDEPLIMTIGDPQKYAFTARDILNTWKEEDIANVIYAYGEERFARRIARNIVSYRQKKPFETTQELVYVVKISIPMIIQRKSKIHPATKTFQALRIIVNDELGVIESGLAQAWKRLDSGGVLLAISFHSLEDRIVKNFIKSQVGSINLTNKPIVADEAMIEENPRSRSARLRAIKKI
jgi:16S rRNA (cytosine1402-N4)-methyltransferase